MYYLKRSWKCKKKKLRKLSSLKQVSLNPEFFSLSVASDLTLCSLNTNPPESGDYSGCYENAFNALQLLLQVHH